MIKISAVFNKWTGWFQSPYAIIISVILGIVIGVYWKGLAVRLSIFGDVYRTLFAMCVLPTVIAALTYSFSYFVEARKTFKYLLGAAVLLGITLLLASLLGAALGWLGKPGENLNRRAEIRLGQAIVDGGADTIEISDKSSDESLNKDGGFQSTVDFINKLIPSNIFKALSTGRMLSILFFAVALGWAIGVFPGETANNVVVFTRGVLHALELIAGFVLRFLPFGLICLLASQVADFDPLIIQAMARYIFLVYLGALILILLSGLMFRFGGGIPFFKALHALRCPLSLAFASYNSYAALPALLKPMKEDLHLIERRVDVLIPMGIVICRFGTILSFALATTYFTQLFQVPFTWELAYGIVLGSILATLTTAGTLGLVSYTLLAPLFYTLDMPFEPALVILLAAAPITEPILNLSSIYLNCAITAVLAKPV